MGETGADTVVIETAAGLRRCRGGTVEITLAEDGSVRMEGEVAVSFAGVLAT